MAEPVGMVLAVAPLIISAFEHYDRIATYCRTFAKYTHRIKANLRALNVQQVIFRKANERLLCHCVEEAQARQMLADVHHRSWQDADIAALYVERLGDSRTAFEDCIGLIAEELAVVKQKLERLECAEDQPGRSLKKRIVYVFKESNIESALAVLREKTQDLVTLIDLSEPQQTPKAGKPSATLPRTEIERFTRINQTAENLYRALGQACTKHTDHQAHLSLETVHSNAAQILFTIAFSRLNLASPPEQANMSTKSAWLTVESSLSGRIEATNDAASLATTQKSLKRVLNEEHVRKQPQHDRKPAKRSVRFLEHPGNNDAGQFKPATPPDPPPAELENLCAASNFCDRLQKFISKAEPSTRAIGFLHLPGDSKHLVYIDAKAQLVMQGLAPSTLTTLCNALRKQRLDGMSGLSLTSRIGVARQLATAVLQFQSTQWLGNSWGSQRILLSHAGTGDEDDIGSQVFISAQIDGPNGSLVRAQSLPSPIVVRNQLLFNLGVLLLELAFQKPLAEMIKETDMNSAHAGNTEFLTADRLSRQVSPHMGPRYAEVVKKCIHCYFASGNDLKQSKLQAEFHQDVICELEKLEQTVKGL
jgi:hypothetical protein